LVWIKADPDREEKRMSTGAVVAIVIGALVVLAVLYFVIRSAKPKREQKRIVRRHRQEEIRHEAERERAAAEAEHAQARASRHDAERKAHEHERRAAELDGEAGRRVFRRDREDSSGEQEAGDRPAARG
jgi:F0F1-type ATP synthase membrane subunit b/b'